MTELSKNYIYYDSTRLATVETKAKIHQTKFINKKLQETFNNNCI